MLLLMNHRVVQAAELAEAGLALLEGTSAGTTSKRKKKALAKAKEAAKEALVKAHETKPEAKGAVEAPNVTEDSMKDGFQADLEKAKQAWETAQGEMTTGRKLDVCVLLELAFSQEQVRMEQDHHQADGKRPICEPTRCLNGGPKGNVSRVV